MFKDLMSKFHVAPRVGMEGGYCVAKPHPVMPVLSHMRAPVSPLVGLCGVQVGLRVDASSLVGWQGLCTSLMLFLCPITKEINDVNASCTSFLH